MLRLATHLPDAAIGLAPVLDGLLDLALSTGHKVSGICSRDLACRYTESSIEPHMSCCIWSYAPLPIRTGRALS